MSEFNLHQWRNKYLFESDLSKGQQKIASAAPPEDEITGADFKALRGMDEDDNQIRPDLKAAYDQGYKAGYAKCKYEMDGTFPDIFESEDHEVSMAMASIKEIISNASQLMNKLGQEERNIPGWIQDHITNAENYINQANKGFHELEYGDEENSINENEFSLDDFKKILNQYPEVYGRGDVIKAYNKLSSLADQDEAKKLAIGKDVLPMPKSSDSSKRRK